MDEIVSVGEDGTVHERTVTMSAAEAKEHLAAITGHPAESIHGYAYILTDYAGRALCHGSNGMTPQDEVTLLRQAIAVSEGQDWAQSEEGP